MKTRSIAALSGSVDHRFAQIVIHQRADSGEGQLLMNRALLTASLAIFLFTTRTEASDEVRDHAISPSSLTVEHAEILMKDNDNTRAEGYLTIWNGTNRQIRLESIQSDAFGRISILRTELNSGQISAGAVNEIVPVPGRAELTMRPSGIRLLLEEPLPRTGGLADSRFTLTFEDGRELVVAVTAVQSRDQLAVHHHGQEHDAID